ncbi:putative transporter [Colletotrichum tanaceti]|nr:putative transporter [Colletotrichum tanaceti]
MDRRDRDDRAGETTPLLSDQPHQKPDIEPATSSSSSGGGGGGGGGGGSCCSWLAEAWILCQYSLPLIATYLLQYSFTVITTFVAGHLSADDLAAASIGLTTMNIIGLAIYEGMATALDTLCAQAHGSGRLTAVGLHIQRMLILMAIATVPIGLFWVFSPSILSLFVKQHHLAVKAGSFLRVSLVGIPGYAAFEALKRFLQAQGDFKSAMVVLIICAPLNALLSWFFAFRLGMGLEGAALGQALANDLRPVFLLVYIVVWGQWSHQCWGGLSRKAFTEWSVPVRLSIAGSAVNIGEWAAFEILTLSTSYLSTEHLAAQTIMTTISVVMWHIPFSISVAISTRIGHLIGAGLVSTARRATTLYAIVFTVVGILDAVLVFVFRDQLGLIFSEDAAVQRLTTDSMLAVAAFQLIDSIINGCNGVLRGLGRQSVAALIVFAVNYLAAVPIAVWLELGSPALELDGAWLGLGGGMVVIAVIECVYLKVIRWQDCVESVREREGFPAVARNKRPCPVCHDLDRDKVPNNKVKTNNALVSMVCPLRQLLQASKKGCQACYAIQQGIMLMGKIDTATTEIKLDVSLVCIYIGHLVRVAAVVACNTPGGTNMLPIQTTFEMFTTPGNPSPWPAFGSARNIVPKLHSKIRKKIVGAWVSDCNASHSLCRETHGPIPEAMRLLPLRFLDLGSNPRNGLKLVGAISSPGPYVAIIHGVESPLPPPSSPTTLENLEARQKCIQWWQIPLALQEALTVAHEQDVRYAWIPEFCVLQDDEQDCTWHLDREDSIFQLAHFTIALTDIKDLRLGNFGPARKITSPEADSDESTASITVGVSHRGRTYPIQIRQTMHWSHWVMAERGMLRPLEAGGKLTDVADRRMGLLRHAPSFQRLLFSRRLLHLHGSEMVWECFESMRCECDDQHYLKELNSMSSLPKSNFHATGYVNSMGDVFDMYMSLPLSDPSERLAHMAAMTRYTGSIHQQRYIAALPANDVSGLAESLLWNLGPASDKLAGAPGTGSQSRRHHSNRVPTWSWASMVLERGQPIQKAESIIPGIELDTILFNTPFLLWGSRCCPAPGSCGDQVMGCCFQLDVEAVLFQATGVVVPGTEDSLMLAPADGIPSDKSKAARFWLDCKLHMSKLKTGEAGSEFCFMPLGQMRVKENDLSRENRCFLFGAPVNVGLVLVPSERGHAPPGAFERVGVFAASTDLPYFDRAVNHRLVLV